MSAWKDIIRDTSVLIRSCSIRLWMCLHAFICTDLDTSVEYVCCSCFHPSFNRSNNETDVGWKYMCINIGIYRNLIHITWYIELESCLPRKEAITKLMWAPDRELEAELGAFIFFHWSAIERRKKWRKKACWYEETPLLNRSICFSHQTLSVALFLHPLSEIHLYLNSSRIMWTIAFF